VSSFQKRLTLLIVGGLVVLGATTGHAAEGPKPVPERYRVKPLEAKLKHLEKGSTRLSELRGKPVLLKLWATWCEPCRDQDKVLDSLQSEFTKRGVQVVAIDEGENPAKVRDFLAKTPSSFPVLLDPYQSLPRLLGVEALPYLATLRSDGSVAALFEGLLPAEGVLQMLDDAATPSGSATSNH
jgi:thiol-disulfide isomerase/thioredoxin